MTDTKEKQNYLKREILDSGYDPSAFLDYMGNHKENGEDIENWTIEELTKIVAQFKETQKEKASEETKAEVVKKAEPPVEVPVAPSVAPSVAPASSSADSSIKVDSPPSGKVNIYSEELPEELKTLQLETEGIGDEELKCEIIEAKVMDPGLFRAKYSSYIMKTNPKGWVAERKFENFTGLRSLLCKMYPGFVVPPLPCKSEKRTEKEDLDKKKRYLQLFLNNLLDHPVLRTAQVLFLFLSVASEKDYETKIKSYAKAKFPHYARDFHSFNGNSHITYDEVLIKFCNSLSSGNTKLKELHKEMKVLNKDLAMDLNKTAATLRR